MRKSSGNASRLCCMAHILMENRNGLIVDVAVSEANGTAERQEALRMLACNAKRGSTVGADKGYDTRDFVCGCRKMGVTPHVASKKSGSAIDGRTIRHEGYRISQRIRKRIEEGFGWLKTVAGLCSQARPALCCRLINFGKRNGLFVAANRPGGGWWRHDHCHISRTRFTAKAPSNTPDARSIHALTVPL